MTEYEVKLSNGTTKTITALSPRARLPGMGRMLEELAAAGAEA